MNRSPYKEPHANPAPAIPEGRENMLGSSLNGPDLPGITLTTTDMARLAALVGDFFHLRSRAVAFLAHELDRAAIVPSDDIPEGVVTMESVVDFRLDDRGKARRATLVYPGEASITEGRISVLTPVGTALLGLSEGQLMPYEAMDGTMRSLTVLNVLSQPEARRPDQQ
jgi:regulator of nucleoside diphosphate kinase